jgi:hypothetical protein
MGCTSSSDEKLGSMELEQLRAIAINHIKRSLLPAAVAHVTKTKQSKDKLTGAELKHAVQNDTVAVDVQTQVCQPPNISENVRGLMNLVAADIGREAVRTLGPRLADAPEFKNEKDDAARQAKIARALNGAALEIVTSEVGSMVDAVVSGAAGGIPNVSAGGRPAPSPEKGAAGTGDDVWRRYPLPEGDWVEVDPAFFWSEKAGLYYYPAAGHFFHPATNKWNDPTSGRWMTEEEHEQLLEQMATAGDY